LVTAIFAHLFQIESKDRLWPETLPQKSVENISVTSEPPTPISRSQSQSFSEAHSPDAAKPANVDKLLKDLLTRETYEEDAKKKQIFEQLTGGHKETLFHSRPNLSSSSNKDASMFRSDELPTPASILPILPDKKKEEAKEEEEKQKTLNSSGSQLNAEPEEKPTWTLLPRALQGLIRDRFFTNLFSLKKNEDGDDLLDMERFAAIMDENLGLYVGMSLAFLVGLFGLSILWVLFLSYMIFRTFTNRSTFIETETLVIKSMTKKTHRRSSSKTVVFGSSIEQKHIGEDCEWMNVMFRELWKNISPNMSQIFRNVFATIAQNYVQNKHPRGIYAIEILHFDLDQISPEFEDIVCSKSLISHVDCVRNFQENSNP
jgi:hypothetical protein